MAEKGAVHGAGENLSWVRVPENAEIAVKLRAAFSAWYDNDHTNKDAPNTCILCIHLISGGPLSRDSI